MNFDEARLALEDGKRIRRKAWPPNLSIILQPTTIIRSGKECSLPLKRMKRKPVRIVEYYGLITDLGTHAMLDVGWALQSWERRKIDWMVVE